MSKRKIGKNTESTMSNLNFEFWPRWYAIGVCQSVLRCETDLENVDQADLVLYMNASVVDMRFSYCFAALNSEYSLGIVCTSCGKECVSAAQFCHQGGHTVPNENTLKRGASGIDDSGQL